MSAKKKYASVFKKTFTDEFPSIISSRKGISFASCSICCSDFSVSHGGRADVIKHVQTQKHKENQNLAEKNRKLNFSVNFNEHRVINAECLFTSFLLEHNLPLNSSDHAAALFRKMFPDSEIARKYACGRTKTTAIVKEIGMTNKSSVVNALKSGPFSISIDGSNKGDSKLYPVVASFLNVASSEIEYSLLGVPNLEGDSTGFNIAKLLIETLKVNEIPLDNCLALSVDNAPVMMGHKNGVAAFLKKEIASLQVMGCPCHLINLVAQRGAACLPVKIDECIIDIFYYLEKSSKRKEKLKEFQQLHDTEVRKILKHVCTRWLSLGKCLARILQQWNPLLTFFKEEVKSCNYVLKGRIESYKIPKLNRKSIENKLVSCEKNKINKTSVMDESSEKGEKPENKAVYVYEKDKMKTKTSVMGESSGNKQKAESKAVNICQKDKIKNKRKSNTAPLQCSKFARKEAEFTGRRNLSREERLFMFLSSNINKAFCLFVQFILPTFEVPNVTLQFRIPQIPVLHSVISLMFKNILSKFVRPASVLSADSIFQVDYNKRENQKTDVELVVGAATLRVVQDLTEEERRNFYLHVRKYFCEICDYILHKFPINEEVVLHAKVIYVATLTEASFSSISFFLNRFPILLSLLMKNYNMDAALDLLQSQFCNLQLQNLEEIKKEERIDTQWILISKLKGADGVLKYSELSKIMLAILTIPHSNAECERIFSLVTKTKTQFRSNFSDDVLEKLLLAKANIRGKCYEENYDPAFLKKAKSATFIQNQL